MTIKQIRDRLRKVDVCRTAAEVLVSEERLSGSQMQMSCVCGATATYDRYLSSEHKANLEHQPDCPKQSLLSIAESLEQELIGRANA